MYSGNLEPISRALINAKSVIIQMDANSKLGNTYVENDPHSMSPNGKILEGIIQRNALIVANGIKDKSDGVITRERTTINGIERSVIDYVLISADLETHMTRCHVDEQRKCVLTKISKTKQGIKRTESDHNTIITKFNIGVNNNKKVKQIEIFNFKDKRLKKVQENNLKQYRAVKNLRLKQKSWKTGKAIHEEIERNSP